MDVKTQSLRKSDPLLRQALADAASHDHLRVVAVLGNKRGGGRKLKKTTAAKPITKKPVTKKSSAKATVRKKAVTKTAAAGKTGKVATTTSSSKTAGAKAVKNKAAKATKKPRTKAAAVATKRGAKARVAGPSASRQDGGAEKSGGPRKLDPKAFPSRVAYRKALIAQQRAQIEETIGSTLGDLADLGLQVRAGKLSRTVVLDGPAEAILKALELDELRSAALDQALEVPRPKRSNRR